MSDFFANPFPYNYQSKAKAKPKPSKSTGVCFIIRCEEYILKILNQSNCPTTLTKCSVNKSKVFSVVPFFYSVLKAVSLILILYIWKIYRLPCTITFIEALGDADSFLLSIEHKHAKIFTISIKVEYFKTIWN